MASSARIPSTSQRNGGRLRPADNLIRAATALVFAQAKGGAADNVLRSLYGDDDVSPVLLRAVTTGATIGDAGWAGSLAAQGVPDFVGSLGPVSAASVLIQRGLQLRFENENSSVSVPGIVSSANGAGYVAEGAPIPVRRLPVGALVLSPRKLASITLISHETVRRTNIEVIVRQALTKSAGLALDAAMLGTAPGDATRPAGLRNGVTALTATAGGGDAAMMRDLGNLAAAVAPVAGSQIAFVAAPSEAVKVSLRANPTFPYPVLASGALAAGTVMALAVNALASAVDPVPKLDASRSATVHMEDATPAHIGTAGGVAAPTQSAFQTAQIALRLQLTASFGLRAAGAVAWIGGATW